MITEAIHLFYIFLIVVKVNENLLMDFIGSIFENGVAKAIYSFYISLKGVEKKHERYQS